MPDGRHGTSALVRHLRGQTRLEALLAGYDDGDLSAVTVYEVEYGARRAGRVSDLEALGTALEHDLDLLTANAEEFGRVPGLRVVAVPGNRRLPADTASWTTFWDLEEGLLS